MKSLYSFVLMMGCLTLGFSQQTGNLVIFSEQGEQFLVVLNGVQQNFNPETNVKVTDLTNPNYKAKIRFIDGKTPDLDKTLYISPGAEITYSLKKHKKGHYVLRMQSEVPLVQAPMQTPNQNVVVYSPNPPMQHNPALQQPNQDIRYNDNTTIIHQNQPTQPNTNVNMGIQVNDPDLGVNMNINVNATEHGQNNTTTYSHTSTQTNVTNNSSNWSTQNQPVNTNGNIYQMPGYTGATGCHWPMDEASFARAYKSIEEKSFESSKLTIAKQVFNTNCMTSDQVKRVLLLFSFEATRLDFAKYAYGYTYDISNYYMLNDAFNFESSIDELNEYILNFQW